MATDEAPRIGRGTWIGIALGITAFASLAAYGDVRELAGKLDHYDFRWFAAGLALATSNYVLRFLRWQAYLHRIGAPVPWASSARIFVSGFSMGITPGKLGEVLKSALLAEAHGVPIERSAPIVLAERLTDLIALVVLVGLGSLAVPHAGSVAPVAGTLVLGLYLVFAVPQLGRFAIDLVERTALGRRIGPKLRAAHDALVDILRPGPLALASLLATCAWSLECVSLWAIARGFQGVEPSFGVSVFAYSGPTLVGALAMLPGGLLVTEASMTGVLQRLAGNAVTSTVAAGITLLVRLATLWWAVALGLVALAWQRRSVAHQVPENRVTND